MIKNYIKTAFRSMRKHRTITFINVAGLSIGMTSALIIGLWIRDEISFDKYHRNYDRIAQVMEKGTYNGTVNTGAAISLPLYTTLRTNYASDFKRIAMCSWTESHILSAGERNISYSGVFMGAEGPELFSLRMIEGSFNGFKEPSAMLISQSAAKALFGDIDPVSKSIKLDNKASFTILGVYEDLPRNSSLYGLAFIGPWEYYITSPGNVRSISDWGDNSLFMYVQITDPAQMDKLSQKIKNVKLDRISPGEARFKPVIFLQPMSKWHLYSEFKNGINTGGAIQYVRLFAIIGVFVLLLACINFMNLSTARSEKRAKEVGIRKTLGSLRGQLINQFYCESFLMVTIAFVSSIAMTWLILRYFNNLAHKEMVILWDSPVFWLAATGFTFFTGFIAGSYPALYLSSFNPVKVLKGSFKTGRFAAIPRKILVIVQFTVSTILIMGTIVVFKQIQFAQNRPVGYSRDGLVNIEVTNDDLYKHFGLLRTDLLKSGTIQEIAESSSPTTGINNGRGDISWKGKDPAQAPFFGYIGLTSEYGKTVGWQFTEGRDFSSSFLSDSLAIVLNEAAVKYMGLKKPVGETLRIGKRDLIVIGVVKDMVMGSPYEPAVQTIFHISSGPFDDVLIKINPNTSTHDALNKIKSVCKTYSPSVPFSYRFADDEYAKKFATEERIGILASSFACLAIFISFLGLFGMASFMAEQRIRELGIRKVLGATVLNLWGLLNKDFIVLIVISLLIATPLAYYFMGNWLQHYEYRSAMPWWIFAEVGLGAILITLITVSYQSIKAALADPVSNLKSE